MIRPGRGLPGYEGALNRAGLGPVAGADEAGRGACAGPLVAAAVVLPPGRAGKIEGLRDSKLLTPAARERLFPQILDQAIATAVVEVSAQDCDLLGMQEADLQALRRAIAQVTPPARYALSDGFPVPGLPIPSLAVWKGDQVASCVAAASILAKVTRDRIMVAYDQTLPGYDFAEHKGYCTAHHQERLVALGPSPIHRLRYVNVADAARLHEEAGRIRCAD